mgnify:FL=1
MFLQNLNTMHPKLKEQKELMQNALNKIFLMEQMIPVIEKWDTTRANVVKQELVEQYADVMQDLRNNLNTIG